MKNLHRYMKAFAIGLDRVLGTSFQEHGGQLHRYLRKKWSPVRRIIDPVRIRLYYLAGMNVPRNVKLHMGCGWKHLGDYVNVDLWITDATDVICDITRLPWPDNSVEVIESYHVIEHISHKKIKKTLAEWYRVLKLEGKLVLECPNFDIVVREYLAGNEDRLINIFGRQRTLGDAHLYGYNPRRLTRVLKEIGFEAFIETVPQSSQTADEPCFRIECKKIG